MCYGFPLHHSALGVRHSTLEKVASSQYQVASTGYQVLSTMYQVQRSKRQEPRGQIRLQLDFFAAWRLCERKKSAAADREGVAPIPAWRPVCRQAGFARRKKEWLAKTQSRKGLRQAGKKREKRNKKQEARDEKQETRNKRKEPRSQICLRLDFFAPAFRRYLRLCEKKEEKKQDASETKWNALK